MGKAACGCTCSQHPRWFFSHWPARGNLQANCLKNKLSKCLWCLQKLSRNQAIFQKHHLQTVATLVKWTFLPDTGLFQWSPLQLLSLPVPIPPGQWKGPPGSLTATTFLFPHRKKRGVLVTGAVRARESKWSCLDTEKGGSELSKKKSTGLSRDRHRHNWDFLKHAKAQNEWMNQSIRQD